MNLVQDIDLSAFMADADSAKVRRASDYADRVISDMYGEKRTAMAKLPWHSLHNRFDLRSGETTIWAGVNGTGKTLMVLQAARACMEQGQGVFIASFELHPVRTMRRMVRHAAAGPEPSEDFIREYHFWTDDKLWLLDHQGAYAGTKVLAIVRWVRANLPVRHVVIDSLMKLDMGPDDYAAQKAFINRLHSLSIELDLHVHLVAHARKGERETDKIDRFSIKGTSEIADQVDNIVLVHRNYVKERKLEEYEKEKRDFTNPDPDMEETLNKWDSAIRIAKQRHGEWEGAVPLWLDRKAQAFSDRVQGRCAPLTLDRVPD